MPRDYYEVLGVRRDADATEIKRAFRVLARTLHPDVNTEDPEAEAKFKEAAEAYEVLSDDERRGLYDQYGHEGPRQRGGYSPNFEGFGSFSDIFEAFFGGGAGGAFGGGGRGGPAQGADIGVQVEIDLAQAATGVKQTVEYETVMRCETCNGNQAEPGTPIKTCERCGGAGQLRAVQRTAFGQMVRAVACDVCGGDGRIPEQPCHTCDGAGVQQREVELDVDIPAGIDDGQRIRVAGRGHAGEAGGASGDLYVLVAVREDERFVRDGDDLVTVVDISGPLAALGTTVAIPTLNGDEDLEIPAGTQPGELLRLRGRGMPSLRGRKPGDLRAMVNVVTPKKLSREQRELLQRVADSIGHDNVSSDEGMVSKLRRLLRT